MKYTINNVILSLDDGFDEIKQAACKKLATSGANILTVRVVKQSVDARKKSSISMVYGLLVETRQPVKIKPDGDVRLVEEEKQKEIDVGNIALLKRPVVVGSGPAGLFAGLSLALKGFKPIILERGSDVYHRTELVESYWKTGKLDPKTNVQFGEGGAGTFSDGKLTTRIHDRRCEIVLKELHKSGAPEEILYKAKPHIGTDILKKVVVDIRRRIEELGGEVRFNSCMTTLEHSNGKVRGVVVNGDVIDTDIVVLAIGHSARDTFQKLHASGVIFVQKPFSIGVRIEHPQEMINRSQYGLAAEHPSLGAADYQLFYKAGGRTTYSFCMCPGGIVVASASEPETIVTNGMSEFARNRENANSAVVVSVEPGDFGSRHPLAGVEFQRKWEKAAFEAGGRNNSAPIQLLKDFYDRKPSNAIGTVKPSYTGTYTPNSMDLCLPEFVTSSMRDAIGYFNQKLKGFSMGDAILTGVETRTSSPVRIQRGETFEAEGINGLYPAGEGAGYAGGIMSAAVDGIKVAEKIISVFYPSF